MKKIIVIGVTASGKTTYASKLSQALNYKHIQLDQLFWLQNWQETPDHLFFDKIKNEISSDYWVLDGNYGRTNHITWKEADTIIWIDLPFWLTLYQSLSRSITRAFTKVELWEGTGNQESFLRMFSNDSIVKWLFKTYWKHKERNELRINSNEYSHLTFHRLKSHKEAKLFLDSIYQQ